jgi:hypothetical protein
MPFFEKFLMKDHTRIRLLASNDVRRTVRGKSVSGVFGADETLAGRFVRLKTRRMIFLQETDPVFFPRASLFLDKKRGQIDDLLQRRNVFQGESRKVPSAATDPLTMSIVRCSPASTPYIGNILHWRTLPFCPQADGTVCTESLERILHNAGRSA